MRIVVTARPNRALPGRLEVFNAAGQVIFSCPCLTKADNARAAREGNRSRDPLRPFGDTPLGAWQGRIGPRFTKPNDVSTYGVHRVIRLHPISGDALIAHRNGRRGIWLHGGSTRANMLRPTFGCIRVRDEHMAAILEILDRHFLSLPPAQQWVPVDVLAAAS